MSDDQLTTYASVAEVIAALAPDEPVYCYWPDAIRTVAKQFVEGFPGRVLYAVKCNPDRDVLRWLREGGIAHFDTASRAEFALVRDLFPDAHCYFNHPVKAQGALRAAYDLYGIRDFVVDHDREFDKLLEVLGSEILVQVRVKSYNPDASYDFSSKFGIDDDGAVTLLRRIEKVGANVALSCHVGSQTTRPAAYADALERACDLIDRAGVKARYINLGGGFPAAYDENVPNLDAFLAAIRDAYDNLGDLRGIPLYCEPGRALVAGGMGLLVQVHLRKDDQLYLNDGIFGSMAEVNTVKFEPPMLAFGRNRVLRGEPVPFKVFGPTCDPDDEIAVPFHLPDDIDDGDWILLEQMGAYSNALVTGFNGFDARTKVALSGTPERGPGACA